MALQFHQSTFDCLGLKPLVSKQREEIIDNRERICGQRFPKSIREWYSIEDAESLFCDHSNADELTHGNQLGEPADLRQGYLRVATENQGVVAWYAKLDGSPDPAVFDNNDEWNDDLSVTNWRLCSKTFSNFIFDMLTAHHFRGWHTGAFLSGEAQFPGFDVINRLCEKYQQGPISAYADSRVRRFFSAHGMIRIASNTPELIESNLARWEVEADSFEALYDLARSFWDFYDLSRTLTAESCTSETRLKGAAVLARLRNAGK